MNRILLFILALLASGISQNVSAQQRNKVRIGVMLPLHDINGDGRRMTEYYRGLLQACDSLKQEGITTDVYAWNVAEGDDISNTLAKPEAKLCDIVFGPLYTTQVTKLSNFCRENNQRLVIPFSIQGNAVETNPNVMQIYQSPTKLNEDYINEYLKQFGDCHTIFIDCNDTTSKKGIFTFGLRKKMEQRGITYNITNLKSSEGMFAKAFSQTKHNVVILNTGRSQELNVALAKLNGFLATNSGITVSLFGYTEWLMYSKYNLDNFHRLDTYIPSTFFYNPTSPKTKRREIKYRWNFHEDMQVALPRFAITGFDQAYFIIKGFAMKGAAFDGSSSEHYVPVQTPLRFVRKGNGGLQNEAKYLIHYGRDHSVETIEF